MILKIMEIKLEPKYFKAKCSDIATYHKENIIVYDKKLTIMLTHYAC